MKITSKKNESQIEIKATKKVKPTNYENEIDSI